MRPPSQAPTEYPHQTTSTQANFFFFLQSQPEQLGAGPAPGTARRAESLESRPRRLQPLGSGRRRCCNSQLVSQAWPPRVHWTWICCQQIHWTWNCWQIVGKLLATQGLGLQAQCPPLPKRVPPPTGGGLGLPDPATVAATGPVGAGGRLPCRARAPASGRVPGWGPGWGPQPLRRGALHCSPRLAALGCRAFEYALYGSELGRSGQHWAGIATCQADGRGKAIREGGTVGVSYRNAEEGRGGSPGGRRA